MDAGQAATASDIVMIITTRQYPAMACVYLALSPGSVPVEQLFSTAGLILNAKRSQLSPFRMNMICFVHDNYKLVWMAQFSWKTLFLWHLC